MATSTELTIANQVKTDLAALSGISGVATVVNWLDNTAEVGYPLAVPHVNPRERLSPNHDLYKCRLDITIATHTADDKSGTVRDSIYQAAQGYIQGKVGLSVAAGPSGTITIGVPIDGLVPLPAQDDFQEDIGMSTISADLFLTISPTT